MTVCSHCNGSLDPATGRHLDDEGQVMDYREDLIQCRPPADVGSLAWWAVQEDKTYCPPAIFLKILEMSSPPRKTLRYSGYDIL